MTMIIPLPKGAQALVDDDMYDTLIRYRWAVDVGGYAVRKEGKKTVFMHRQIANPPAWAEVDHVNRIKLDNRMCNLRLCTSAQNSHNMGISSRNTSGYKGVSFVKKDKTWAAKIQVNGSFRWIGVFDTSRDAGIAYNHAAVAYYGDFAWVNDIPGWEATVPKPRLRVAAELQSGIPGIVWSKSALAWRVRVCRGGIRHHIGNFRNINDAIEARRVYTESLHG